MCVKLAELSNNSFDKKNVTLLEGGAKHHIPRLWKLPKLAQILLFTRVSQSGREWFYCYMYMYVGHLFKSCTTFARLLQIRSGPHWSFKEGCAVFTQK